MTIWTRRFASALVMATALLCGGNAAVAQNEVRIRIGYATPPTGPHAPAAKGFEEELAKLAPGRFKIENYASGSVGGDREMAEALQLGTLDMAIMGSTVLGNFMPEMMVLEMPFLFRDTAHARKALDGAVGKHLLDGLSSAGIVGLAFGEIGFRQTTNSKRPIRTVADIKGLKIRLAENPVPLAAWRALGALPTPMAFPELYTALQQGTIDGQENPLSIIIPSRLYEPQKHLTITNHAFTPVAILFSKSVFDKLKPEDQANIRAAAKIGAEANRRFVEKTEKDGMAELERRGIQIVKSIDTAEFEERMKPVYSQFERTIGKMVNEVKAIQ